MNSINRQSIYILILTTFLLVFVLVFSFVWLIPNGKEYREQRMKLSYERADLRRWKNFDVETLETLKKLQSDNRHIITAFDNSFNQERFIKKYKSLFNKLELSKTIQKDNVDVFELYEVRTSSQISSPATFYNFLDEVNKSDWIIGINFPIEFKRDAEVINSTFTMKVYCNANEFSKDSNTSKLVKK